MTVDPVELVAELAAAGVGRGARLGIAFATGVGAGLATTERTWQVAAHDPIGALAQIERALHPRWTWWTRAAADGFVAAGLRVGACWDVDAVHQLLFGGHRPGPAAGWARLRGLTAQHLPRSGQLDLLSGLGGVGGDGDGGDAQMPVRPDGYLRPEWADGGWRRSTDRLARWASTALEAASMQSALLADLQVGGDPELTALSESAAELLGAELQADGLPVDRDRADALVAETIGGRPRDDADAARLRRERDAFVLRHARNELDLRNPAQVKAMLTAIGIDVPDTRSWRLEPFRTAHPLVPALLAWRKAERIATTYGYGWLDANVVDGRLRGRWLGSDGAAGRMTASAGLHNLPSELRPAVAAQAGHVFVRADLGQVEPRVLAVVSGDPGLALAGQEDDMYAPVAHRLGVDRATAKIAVLAAMYGQTSGTAGQALRGLTSAYPTAMHFLDAAYGNGRDGHDVRTYGGRLVRMPGLPEGLDEDGIRNVQGSRGRFARNAVVQGAAAEFFKVWAVTVRSRGAAIGARIVLCLHDELLVHVAAERADPAVELVNDCLSEAAARWQAERSAVRFVADVKIMKRWSEAKA